MLRPGIVGMRGCMAVRLLRPCVACVHPGPPSSSTLTSLRKRARLKLPQARLSGGPSHVSGCSSPSMRLAELLFRATIVKQLEPCMTISTPSPPRAPLVPPTLLSTCSHPRPNSFSAAAHLFWREFAWNWHGIQLAAGKALRTYQYGIYINRNNPASFFRLSFASAHSFFFFFPYVLLFFLFLTSSSSSSFFCFFSSFFLCL